MAASGSYSLEATLTMQFKSAWVYPMDLSTITVLSESCGDALAHSWQCCYIFYGLSIRGTERIAVYNYFFDGFKRVAE